MIRSCQFVQVDIKVNTTLLVLREHSHAGKGCSQKWGSAHVVSITWCRSRSVIQIMWCKTRSMTKVLCLGSRRDPKDNAKVTN